jgi:hypothetical protein
MAVTSKFGLGLQHKRMQEVEMQVEKQHFEMTCDST